MKKGNFILGVIVGILLIAIMAGCFYLGTKFANRNNEKSETETKEETKKEELTEEFKDVKLTDDLVLEAKNFSVYEFCNGSLYDYPGKSVTVDNLPDSLKVEMAFINYAQKIYDKLEEAEDLTNISALKIKEEELKRYFEDLSFLNKYKDGKDFYLKSILADGFYKDGAFFFTPEIGGCEGPGRNGVVADLIGAKKNNKELVLSFVVYYREIKIDDDDNVTVNAYVNEKDKKAAETKVEYDEEKGRYDIDIDKYHQYEYVFDISEGNLQLKAINYVK